jgi:hypothetical protein
VESRKNLLVWGSLVVGVVLILFSFYLGRTVSVPLSPTLTLARAEPLTGEASVLRHGMTAKETLKRKISLGHFDSIETRDLGEVRLDFETAYRVRVKEHSLITLERVEDQDGFHTVLILKRGQIQVENYGREGDLFIAKNGERISATDYQESPLAQAQVTEAEPSSEWTSPAPEGTGLTEKEVQETMTSHRTSFLKCYSGLLQKDAQAKGQATLTFTVENSGKLKSVEVTSSDFQQEDFKKCLIEVMNRVEFRPFDGSPISTLFPLKFE